MGETFALLTAVFWGGAVILFRRAGETLPPLILNLFRVSVSSVLLLATMLVMGQMPWRDASWQQYLLIIASGVVGIAVADTLFHASLNRIGAGLTGIVDCLYPPMTAVFAFVLLEERLTTSDVVGMVLVVGAVLVSTRVVLPAGMSRRNLLVGLSLGATGMAALSFGVVIAKPVLNEQPVVWVTGMRQFAALAVLLPYALLSRERAALGRMFRMPGSALRFALPGTVLGSYFSLLCWLAGMKFTGAGTAAVLNQTSTIYIIILARIFLHESFTRRKVLACVLAVGGVLAVVLG